jgi:hypothetical protein
VLHVRFHRIRGRLRKGTNPTLAHATPRLKSRMLSLAPENHQHLDTRDACGIGISSGSSVVPMCER